MLNNSAFIVRLDGLNLNKKETAELEHQIRDVTVKFLAKTELGKDFINDAIEFTPLPDDLVRPDLPSWFPPRPFPGFYAFRRNIVQASLRTVIGGKSII